MIQIDPINQSINQSKDSTFITSYRHERITVRDCNWWLGVAVTRFIRSTKLTYAGLI